MKPLSPPTAELLAQLNEPVPWLKRLGRDEHKVRALSALVDHASPSIVPHIAPLVFARSTEVRRAAALVLDRALAVSTPRDLLELDKVCRQRCRHPGPWGNDWDTLSPLRLSLLEKWGRVGPGALGVASFHASGYVREAAVKHLDASAEGRELAFLLVRLNDWVPPVALRARAAVERRILPAHARAWLAWFPLLLRLGTKTRQSPGDLVDRVLSLLRAPKQRTVLLTALSTENRLTRRFALQLLSGVHSTPDERAGILTTALHDHDTIVRLQAVAYAQTHLTDAELESTIPRMLADRFSPVRRAALNVAAERLGEPANRWLVNSLGDRGPTVREVARYHLERRGELTDFASHYRSALEGARTASGIAAAAAGLGDTGTHADVELIAPLLAHENAGVRRAAARALASLDFDSHSSRLLALIDDQSPGVARVARNALYHRATGLKPDAIRHLMQHAVYAHGRLGALSLAAVLSKWESIPLLLEAAASTEDALRAEATARVTAWLARQNESFARPSKEHLAAFHAALALHGAALAPRTARELESVLEYWATQ